MKLKIAVAISILSFFIVSTATLTSYLVIKERNEHNPIPNNTTPVPSANPTDLTLAKISEHNSVTDCWIIIDSKVYEVSKFLDLHAGGGFAIIPYCGKDATSAFNTKDKNPQQNHSNTAVSMLTQYYIGDVGSPGSPPTAKTTVTQTSAPQTANTTNLTSAEISSHNKTSDCWIIVSNNVYNVTNYLIQHPGGIPIIASYCGKEATVAFQTQGGQGSHSNTAYSLLKNYLIGTVGSTVSVPTTNSNPPPAINNRLRVDDD